MSVCISLCECVCICEYIWALSGYPMSVGGGFPVPALASGSLALGTAFPQKRSSLATGETEAGEYAHNESEPCRLGFGF